jgi:hypothetical protein
VGDRQRPDLFILEMGGIVGRPVRGAAIAGAQHFWGRLEGFATVCDAQNWQLGCTAESSLITQLENELRI